MNISQQNEKLTTWRQSKGYSTRALSEEIQKRMKADYPDGFPRGVKVTQTDVRRAESYSSRKSYEKVTSAIYNYFGITPDYFGPYENPSKKYKQEAASHAVLETTIEYQSSNIAYLQKLVETQSKLIQQLENENAELRRQISKLPKV